MIRIFLFTLFYLLMALIFLIADGKIDSISKQKEFKKWHTDYGSKVKKWIIVLSILFLLFTIFSF